MDFVSFTPPSNGITLHRLSTIRDADVILYMENGDIKEMGNHESLMALHRKYEALYRSQFVWARESKNGVRTVKPEPLDERRSEYV